MRIKRDFPRRVREPASVWIPLSDGCSLSARVWLPEDAEDDPVPAILEYLPYRKNDATAVRDAVRHPYFAGHGYAAVRVDMRGSGDSDGILEDEYLPKEQDDALEVLAWLAAQPWCTGATGMIGISWGGFTGLQVAARRPPELKAVIALSATHDRYLDDVHYAGGCVHEAMLPWASSMLAYNARPPDPAAVGERWRELWLDRMERTPPFVESWLSHQRRDDHWRHGSVGEDYDSIRCPVYIVSGWRDWYRNPVASLLESLPGPRKGLIGPWGHVYPETSGAGGIGFLQECLRWWDQWLKGIETGIMDEPMLVVWMPEPAGSSLRGRWLAEPSWPSPNVSTELFALNEGTLEREPRDEVRLDLLGLQSGGIEGGAWGFTTDQRREDGCSLSFTSAPLAERVEILGLPHVVLTLACDRPNALVAVRLCDVAPNGVSTFITRGVLNLTHRESDEEPTPLEPGRRYTVHVRLELVAYAVPAGHRLRVAVAPTSWPRVWPSPEPVTLSVFAGPASRLELPVRAAEDDGPVPAFGPPEGAAPLSAEALRGPSRTTVSRDVASGRVELASRHERAGFRFEDGLVYEATTHDVLSIVEDDPLSAGVRSERTIAIGRGPWQTRVETRSELTSTRDAFRLTNELAAYEADAPVFRKAWELDVPRVHG